MPLEEPVLNTSEGSPVLGSSADAEQQIWWLANKRREAGDNSIKKHAF